MVGFFASFEVLARCLVRDDEFQGQIAYNLRGRLVSSEPDPPRDDEFLQDLGWSGGGVSFRMRQDGPVIEAPHMVGGEFICDALRQPADLGMIPEYTPYPDSKRVFVAGGSSAYGYPYGFDRSFTHQLDRRLTPRGWFFLNAARPRWSSGKVLAVVRRLVKRFEMKALILYSGNNEFNHWSDGELPRYPQPQIHLLLSLNKSLAASWMLHHVCQIQKRLQNPTRMVGGFEIQKQLLGSEHALAHPGEAYSQCDPASWSATKTRFLDTYEANLRSMVSLAKSKNIPVILLTIPFNYRLSPAWQVPQPESVNPLSKDEVRAAIAQAASARRDRRFEAALEILSKAKALDPAPSIIHYLEGECLRDLGRHREAEDSFAISRENMVGIFGSVVSINKRIRRVIEDTHAIGLDAKKLFDEYCHREGRWYNEGLIRDYCHPTPAGHALLASAIEKLLLELDEQAEAGKSQYLDQGT